MNPRQSTRSAAKTALRLFVMNGAVVALSCFSLQADEASQVSKTTKGTVRISKVAKGTARISKRARGKVRISKPVQGSARSAKPAPGKARIAKQSQGTTRIVMPAPGTARIAKAAPGKLRISKKEKPQERDTQATVKISKRPPHVPAAKTSGYLRIHGKSSSAAKLAQPKQESSSLGVVRLRSSKSQADKLAVSRPSVAVLSVPIPRELYQSSQPTARVTTRQLPNRPALVPRVARTGLSPKPTKRTAHATPPTSSVAKATRPSRTSTKRAAGHEPRNPFFTNKSESQVDRDLDLRRQLVLDAEEPSPVPRRKSSVAQKWMGESAPPIVTANSTGGTAAKRGRNAEKESEKALFADPFPDEPDYDSSHLDGGLAEFGLKPQKSKTSSTRRNVIVGWQADGADSTGENVVQADLPGALKSIGTVTTDICLPAEGKRPNDMATRHFENAGSTQEVEFGSYHGYAGVPRASDLPEYDFYQRPLYFEDGNLERCGVDRGMLQPVISAAYFYGTIPLLPYKMVVQRPNKCVWSLGDCPPCYKYSWYENYLPPLRADAALVEAGWIVGMIFLIP